MMSAGNNGVDVSYNVQSAVDSKNKLITGIDVTSNPNDQGRMAPMAKQVKENLNLEEMTVLADKGYYVIEDIAECEKAAIVTMVSKPKEAQYGVFPKSQFIYNEEHDHYICPAGKFLPKATKNGMFIVYHSPKDCKVCPLKSRCTKGKRRDICRHPSQPIADRANARFDAKLYHKRQELVEHPFGTIKRTMGIRQFLTRGLKNVTAEVALIFTVYNLKRLRKLMHFDQKTNEELAVFCCFYYILALFFNTKDIPLC